MPLGRPLPGEGADARTRRCDRILGREGRERARTDTERPICRGADQRAEREPPEGRSAPVGVPRGGAVDPAPPRFRRLSRGDRSTAGTEGSRTEAGLRGLAAPGRKPRDARRRTARSARGGGACRDRLPRNRLCGPRKGAGRGRPRGRLHPRRESVEPGGVPSCPGGGVGHAGIPPAFGGRADDPPSALFWLDLNFWASEALARLGEGHQAAAEAVRVETALLLRRLPGLEDLKFSDGTPFAADDTREWLKGLSAGGGGAAAGSAGAAPDPAAKGLRQAREWIAEGRTAEAVRKMQQGVRGGGSRKDAFQWRVALCRLLVETPEARHALPHIEEILKEIDLFRLEEYDPDLALKGLRVAWDGYRANAGLVPEEKVVEIQGRIARVDVSAAMSLGGE
ncbi:MAG: hypothetical protein B7Z62_01610 [Deltaproteobacteria bacterium 37-65-8]|nr:MAG: hypothetical protein B7Z62_01610 [Deltaproteobacteria bacterium 37-65-8]